MKSNKKIISALMAVTFLGMSSISAYADSNTTTGTDKTSTGVAVTDGTLSIDSVPSSLAFSSTVDDIANNTSTSANTTTSDELKTTDNLGYGPDTDWTLTATPSKLSYTDSSSNSHDLSVASLTINGKTITTLDGTTATTVATGTDEGTTSTPISSSNTSIDLNQDEQVYGQSYTGTITWTLTENAGTTSSAS